jgi:hypothetical protein
MQVSFFLKGANGCVETERKKRKKKSIDSSLFFFLSGLGSWERSSIPSQLSIAFLYGRKATVELKTVHP